MINDMLKKIGKFNFFATLFFLLAPFLFFGKMFFLSGENRMFIGSDFIHYFNGFFHYVSQLREGNFPFWNHYMFGGMPFFARGDLALLYPINFLWAGIGALFNFDVRGLYVWYEMYLMFHLSLGGIFCYLFARNIKISKIGSLLAGIFFMFSGTLLMMINAIPLITSSVWIPLVLLFYKKSLENDGRKEIFYALITTLIISISHFSGYIQISLFYSGIFLLMFCVYFLISNQVKFGEAVRKLAILISISVVSLVIYSVQLIPTFNLLNNSNREEISFVDSIFYGAIRPSQTLDLLVPNLYRYFNENRILVNEQVSCLYFGILPLIFFLIGIFYFKNKYNSFFVLTFFVFLIASFGGFTSFYEYLVVFIPKLDSFRNVNKVLYLNAFSFSLVAGMGVDYVIKKKNDLKLNRIFIWFLSLSFPFLFIRVITIFLFSEDKLKNISFKENIFDSVFFLLIQVLLSFLLLYYLAESEKKNIFIVLAIVLVFFDLANFNSRTLPNNSHVDPYYYLGSKDEKCTVCQIESTNDFGRVIFVGGMYGPQYAPNVMGFFNAGGYSSFVLENSSRLINEVHAIDKTSCEFVNKLSKLGVKYVVSSEEIKNEKLTLININTVDKKNRKNFFDYGGDGIGIVNKVIGKQEFLYLNNDFDGVVSSESNYDIEEFKSEYIKIKLNSNENTKVAIRMQDYPGWEVYVNGNKVEKGKNQNGFINFEIGAGDSIAELFYKEKQFVLGLNMTIFSLVIVLFLILKFRKDDKKTEK